MKREEAIKVYDIQHSRFRQTKELQWKINLASWALIALGVNYSEKFRNVLSKTQVWSIVIVFFIAQMIFSWRTQRALEGDKKISKHILDNLSINTKDDQNIKIDIENLLKNVKIRRTGWWWLFFQAFTTGILLYLFVIACTKH